MPNAGAPITPSVMSFCHCASITRAARVAGPKIESAGLASHGLPWLSE
jgi:hypothetical protein